MSAPLASDTTTRYRSYLIRIWQSHEHGSYRASAQCVQTGNTVLFGALDHLLIFLQTEVNATLIIDDAGSWPPGAPPPPADDNGAPQ